MPRSGGVIGVRGGGLVGAKYSEWWVSWCIWVVEVIVAKRWWVSWGQV